jgi:acyl-CoA ligase (AMP-forming) (exosortase A-associated)
MGRLDDLLERGAGDAVALVDANASVTYGELRTMVDRLAAGLQAAGLRPGELLPIYTGQRVEAVAAFFAACRIGAAFVPVNPRLKAAQVAHILEDSGASLLLTDTSRLAQSTTLGEVRALTIDGDWATLTGSGKIGRNDAPAAADALAAVLYTSGSTGRPKGVMLSHRNILVGARSVVSYLGNDSSDRILAALPLSFDYGLNQVTTALHAGATAILLDYLTPRDVLKAIERHRATGLAGVPPLWMQLADLAWPEEAAASLRYITNSGGRMPAWLTRRLRLLLPQTRIFLMYGLTEAFRSTYLDPSLVDERPESIGTAIPDAEVLVARADGSLTDDGEPGELVHAGPLVAMGYWRDPERTAQRFRPAPHSSLLGGTAVWSGDKVVRDADGLLTFVGRDDDMIKTSGYRVSPTEVEEAAFATGLVSEASAVGVEDERLGQAILLAAVPNSSATPAGASSDRAEGASAPAELERALSRSLQRALPSYMMPRRVVWMDALPRSPNGKIDRGALKAALSGAAPGVVAGAK